MELPINDKELKTIVSALRLGGDAALYFDPLSVEAIEETIEKIIFDIDLQKTMSEKSLIQSKRFSWDKTAQQTEEVYAKVLGLQMRKTLRTPVIIRMKPSVINVAKAAPLKLKIGMR